MDGLPETWHSEGQGFESPRVHQILYTKLRLPAADRCGRNGLTPYLTAYLTANRGR